MGNTTHPYRVCVQARRGIVQAGFTLLELIVIIGLLSILALGASAMLEDDGQWRRAEENPKRWDAIRQSVVGTAIIDATGNPSLNGYVTDMGRLPQNIKELISLGTQPVWEYEPLFGKTASVTCVPTDVPSPDCYYLAGGWRGPYLYTAGSQFYRDGWDNVDSNSAVDDVNFGWQVSVSGVAPNHSDLFVRSLGFGNALDATPPADSYRLDYPENTSLAMVSANEWQNTQASLQFNLLLNKPVTTDISNLYLRVYFIDNAVLDDLTSAAFNIANTDRTASVSISPSSDLPMGRYAAVIYCETAPVVDPATAVFTQVFDSADGTCNTDNDTAPFYFQLLPNTAIVNMAWNLP